MKFPYCCGEYRLHKAPQTTRSDAMDVLMHRKDRGKIQPVDAGQKGLH
jgi:hypothetical protein